jgi:hypothetical protein
MTETAIVRAPEQAFEPNSITEALNLAGLLVASRLLPRSVTTPEAAFAIIATGRELGLTAMQSLRTIHVIEGKPTLSADLIAALVKSRRDVCEFFMLVESTEKKAVYKTKRVGEPEATTLAWTIEDASRAGLTSKDNWRKFPAAMLRARCITALARTVYPDLAMGVYDPDELDVEPVARMAPVVVQSQFAREPEANPVANDSAQVAPKSETFVSDDAANLECDICAALAAAQSLGDLRTVALQIEAAQKTPAVKAAYDKRLAELKLARGAA